jgi:hypothetical protein
MKNCTKCGEQKPLSDFYKSVKSYDGLQSCCKLCHKAVCKISHVAHKIKRNLYNKKYNIEKNYGISFDDYLNLIKSQNGNCQICKSVLIAGKNTHLDHCHTTGKIRGVLCGKCNTGIGQFNDSLELLKSALKYLKKYS